MEFKDRLKKLRNEKNLTQDALAFEIHVSRSTVAKWEAGLGLPQKDSLEELCRFFDMTEDELVSKNIEEETLIKKNLKIHRLNKRVFLLMIIFCFLIIALTVTASIVIRNMQDLNEMKEIHIETKLMNHVNVNGKKVATAGKIDRKETLLKNEYGYSYQNIEFEKIQITEESSLVLIKVIDQFAPGSVAYQSNNDYFRKKATLNKTFTEIKFGSDVNIIYSWPNLNAEWVSINSLYGSNVVYDGSLNFTSIHLQVINNQLQFYYQESFDDVILSKDKKQIIRDFDFRLQPLSSRWTYQMYEAVHNQTFQCYSYYLIEVNDLITESFDFSLTTGMVSGKHELKRKQVITCYW